MSVLGVAGAVVGGLITMSPQGAMLGYSLGAGVDALVNAPDIQGPRLEDLNVQLSSYGANIPFEWGTNRHAGTVIWPKLLELVEHEHSESAKGGPESTTYSYTASFAVEVCEGPIKGIRRIWANKKIIYDVSVGHEGPTKDPAISGLRIYLGTETQEVDPLIEATDGPSPAYLGYAYVVFEDLALGDFGNRPPSLEFEVITEGSDEIPASSQFGESYWVNQSTGSYSHSAAMDTDTGHIWLTTMGGHATLDPATGKYVIDPGADPRPQIQEYDPVTKELLFAQDVAAVGGIYPMMGSMVYSGGYIFIGRGTAGGMSAAFAHGMAINTQTHSVAYFTDQCSHEQFQNAFYWPSVPVPVLDNNKVYFATSNGVESSLAVGFMPAGIMGAGGAAADWPAPDRSDPDAPKWNAPVDWAQSRPLGQCPANKQFDGTALRFPSWAYKSTVIANETATIVQGYGGDQDASFLTWVFHTPRYESGFDLSAAQTATTYLPGSKTDMPPIAWDAKNEVLWAFAGDGDSYDNRVLYEVRFQGGELTATPTGFSFPQDSAPKVSTDVRGMTVDPKTGFIRAIVSGSGFYANSIVLIDPINGTVVDTYLTDLTLVNASGPIFDYPEQNKLIFSNSYGMYDIPYAAALDATPIQLARIVRDICLRTGLTDADIDVSQLTDMVDGYAVTRQMTARAAIEPLQTAFYFDAVESGDRIKFVKRGGAVAAVIPMEDRAAHDYGSDLPDSLSITRAQDLELPVEVSVEYSDIDADHLIGSQYERRLARDTRQKVSIQSPVVMTATKAKEVSVVTLYRAWLNQSYKFATTRKWAHLEPTDIITLPTREASYTARITSKREQPNGVIEWEAAMESVSVYTQTAVRGAPINYIPQAIYNPSATNLELLDIPMLRDADNDGGFYVAMG